MDINIFYKNYCCPKVFNLPAEEVIYEYDKYYAIPADYGQGSVYDKNTGKIVYDVKYGNLPKVNKVWHYNEKMDRYE